MAEVLRKGKLVLDTSVLIEYIVERSPYRNIVERLFEESVNGEVELYINYITLSEAFYIASRVYKAASISNPNVEALNYISWIGSRVKMIDVDNDIAIRAGEIKKLLHIALPDCYVIASAKVIGGTPLFKKVEEEMKRVKLEMEKLGVRFLDEISI